MVATEEPAAPSAIRTPDQRLRVFVSSTLGELADERSAARSAIEQLRLAPVMFEAGARPHPPRALYRAYLAQSDVFVGIYWQRYGWVAPDMEISGLEDELRLSAGMPRLIYVKRPAPEMEAGLSAMLHGLEGDDGPSYKPFTTADQLQRLLADDLAILLAERFQRGGGPSAAPSRWPVSLPAGTSTFVGREAELARLRDLLGGRSARLVTVAGPGGSGKTRLAVEAAWSVLDGFEDGAQFVDLTEEREADAAFGAVARTLPSAGEVPGTPLERIEAAIARREVLLVLDNVEQVTSIGPGLVQLLQRCPRLQILVTSRELLRVGAEHVVPLPPLSLPAVGPDRVTVESVLASESGRLFVDRATAGGSGFTLTEEDAADVAAVCRRLDGLPLAIELAAARVGLLSVAELRSRLEQRLDVLSGGSRDHHPRQWTLPDAIEWSEDLLTEDERLVFRAFSVFSDGRLSDVEQTLRAVEDTAAVRVEEALSSLVDKSLVRVEPGSDRRPRLSMLQTIRQYASERLADSPAVLDRVRAAHAAHYCALALGLQNDLAATDRAVVLGRLTDELGNLRAAWQYWVAQRDLARLDELLGPLWGYHEARGDYQAAIVLGEQLLATLPELPETQERRHDELALRAIVARTQLAVHGFSAEAEQAINETLDRYEAAHEARRRFPALRSLNALQLWRSDFASSAVTARELQAIAEDEGDPDLLTEAHLMTCISESWLRDVPTAIEHADRAAAHFRDAPAGRIEFRVGTNPGVVATAVAGLLRWTAGFPESAEADLRQSLVLADEIAHPFSQAFARHHAMLLDLWRSDSAAVVDRAEESLRLAERHHYPMWRALALLFRGAARVAASERSEGLAELEDAFALCERLPTPPVFWPLVLQIRATAHGAAGEVRRALDLIEEAWARLGGEHPVAGELALARGDLVLDATGDRQTAGERFRLAATLAGARRARMVELQALTRLVVVATDEPDAVEAVSRLREVYDSFTEGSTSPPLVAAAAALAATTRAGTTPGGTGEADA